MRLVKGKVRFIRSMIACVLFPVLLCFFYSYVQIGSNWKEVNIGLGILLAIICALRGVFEMKVAKNKANTKFSFMGTIVVILYIIIRVIG